MVDGIRNVSQCAVSAIQPSAAHMTNEHIKYEMFCKWLEMCNTSGSSSINGDIGEYCSQVDHLENLKEREDYNTSPYVSTDEVVRYSSEDDDEFLDSINEADLESIAPIVTEDNNQIQFNIIEVDNTTNTDPENNLDIDIDVKKILPILLNISPMSSSSDITGISGSSADTTNKVLKQATHNKGKAPAPPATARLESNSSKGSNTGHEPCANVAHSSPDGKDREKKKKNLLSYLPGIFRPISPSSTSHNVANTNFSDKDEQHHETLL